MTRVNFLQLGTHSRLAIATIIENRTTEYTLVDSQEPMTLSLVQKLEKFSLPLEQLTQLNYQKIHIQARIKAMQLWNFQNTLRLNWLLHPWTNLS